MLAGIFARRGAAFSSFGPFLIRTTPGNAIGGVFFVALFKYSHVNRGGLEPESVHLEEATEDGSNK